MDFMTRKVGPLPVWAYLVVIGIGLAFAFLTNRGSGGSTPEVIYPEGVGVGTGPGTPGFIPVEPPEEPGVGGLPLTNEEWLREAAQELIRRGYEPSIADVALRKYLNGQALTTQERSMVNAALRIVGPPPVAPPPPDPTTPDPDPEPEPEPEPTPKPTPKPKPKQINVTVKKWPHKLSTLWGIAEHYYGNGLKWRDIYNANRNKIRRPDLIYPGWVLVVPNPTKNLPK